MLVVIDVAKADQTETAGCVFDAHLNYFFGK